MASPLSYCLALIKRRLRSRHELEQAMSRREIPAEEQAAVLTQLEAAGLVNDLQFARAWIHTRDRFNPRGAMLLRAELMQKGIADSLIKQVLSERKEEAESEEDQPSEIELAQQLVKSKERLYRGLAPEVRERRIAALLGRRGFAYEVIRRILYP